MDRPNILLIMSDQQRWDTLGCYGYPHMITPHLDRLAARGAAFSHAFVQGAVCGPSRNSIVSARYVHVHGVEENQEWLDDSQPNFIAQLRDGGYHTVGIGKMHTQPLRLPCGFEHRMVVENKNCRTGLHYPDPDDFDLFLARHGLVRPAPRYYRTVPDWPDCLQATAWPHAEELYPDNFTGRRAADYIGDWEFDRPLFMWLGFAGPHDPFDAPESALARYDGVEVPDPVALPGELDGKPPEQRQGMLSMEGKETPAALWWSRATPERVRRMRRHYYANVAVIDDWVGRIEQALEARGQLDNTLIAFTSDHGECLGDHDMVYKFWCHYDPVVRVPLVFAGPGVRQAGIRDPLVELIDLGPTLLDCAGLDPLPGAQGRSMRSLLEGGTEPLHEAVFSQEAPRLMVRTRDFKLVFYIDRPYGELYDLEADPGELHNLFDDEAHRETRQSLQERLLRWFTSHRMTR